MRPSVGPASWVWTRKEKQQTGAAANVTLWDPAAGASVFVWRITVTTSAACTVQITEGNDAGGTRIIDAYLPDNGGIDFEFPFEAPYKLAADAILKLTTSTGNSKVVVHGIERVV